MLRKIFSIIFIVITICNSSNSQSLSTGLPADNFKSLSSLIHALDSLGNIEIQLQREDGVKALWNQLIIQHRIPFTISDSVLFLYKGNAQNIAWAGDFNGWNPGDSSYRGKRAGKSNIWYLVKEFPPDSRLDYKIVVNKEWILDTANSNIQYSGFGPNSELRMPGWKYPVETIPQKNISHGSLSNDYFFRSRKENLNYKIQYKVYLPYAYEKLKNLPVAYVTDGEEYSETLQGGMIETLDNLIYEGKIKPIIAIFIDPCNPDTLYQNRRMQEYRESTPFINFVCQELVPHIDSNYHTIQNPDARLIMGASLGGWNAAWFGLKRADIFHLIGIQSPAFTDEIIKEYSASPLIPLKIFMSTGTIHDTQKQALKMKSILEKKNYLLSYIEVNEGHSWGNWRALIDDILIYFFSSSGKNFVY
jgi:enterochelin esterase-like enzyme